MDSPELRNVSVLIFFVKGTDKKNKAETENQRIFTGIMLSFHSEEM
jgi:hypothetical protein